MSAVFNGLLARQIKIKAHNRSPSFKEGIKHLKRDAVCTCNKPGLLIGIACPCSLLKSPI